MHDTYLLFRSAYVFQEYNSIVRRCRRCAHHSRYQLPRPLMHVVACDDKVAHMRELSKSTVPRLSDVWRTPKSSYRGYVVILPIKHRPGGLLRSKVFLFIGQPAGPALIPRSWRMYLKCLQHATLYEIAHTNGRSPRIDFDLEPHPQ